MYECGKTVYSSTIEMLCLYINKHKNHHKRNSNSSKSRAYSKVWSSLLGFLALQSTQIIYLSFHPQAVKVTEWEWSSSSNLLSSGYSRQPWTPLESFAKHREKEFFRQLNKLKYPTGSPWMSQTFILLSS